jgi:hypothetical protein
LERERGQEDFRRFVEGFKEAGKKMVDPHYFQLPIAGEENPAFRERVYCYELYHHLRNVLGDAFPYKLDGEVDKNGHPRISGKKKPDFIVHIPGEMDYNLVVIEVKPVTVNEHDLEYDLRKLVWLLDKGKYFRAIMLIFGNGKSQLSDRIKSRVAELSKKWKDRILLAWHRGSGEKVEIL